MQLINVPFSATQDVIMKALADCGEPQDVRFIVDQYGPNYHCVCLAVGFCCLMAAPCDCNCTYLASQIGKKLTGRSNTGKHKGICYVEFATEDEASLAVAKSGFDLNGRRVATSFAKEARPKDKISARKQQKW